MTNNLFLPDPNHLFNDKYLWKWYLNVPLELRLDFLSSTEKAYMASYYAEAGLLKAWRKPFFRYHYARSFAIVVQHFFGNRLQPRILDLGCGTGTQALFLAAMGADVIGIDLDSIALKIFEKRKLYYEKVLGRKLKIMIIDANAFDLDYQAIGPLDGMWSMFAFNLMQPSLSLLNKICPEISMEGVIAVLDGNNLSWVSRLFWHRRRDVLSPVEFCQELHKRSFNIVYHRGGISLIPLLWFIIPYSVATIFDQLISENWFAPISHLLIAKRSFESHSVIDTKTS
jgi:SAM-dependent methyltransferase